MVNYDIAFVDWDDSGPISLPLRSSHPEPPTRQASNIPELRCTSQCPFELDLPTKEEKEGHIKDREIFKGLFSNANESLWKLKKTGSGKLSQENPHQMRLARIRNGQAISTHIVSFKSESFQIGFSVYISIGSGPIPWPKPMKESWWRGRYILHGIREITKLPRYFHLPPEAYAIDGGPWKDTARLWSYEIYDFSNGGCEMIFREHRLLLERLEQIPKVPIVGQPARDRPNKRAVVKSVAKGVYGPVGRTKRFRVLNSISSQ